MVKPLFVLAVLASATAVSVGVSRAPAAEVPYPEGYRQWVHVKSQLVGPGNPLHARRGGMQHVYANAKAMAGLPQRNFPEGSMFVVDVISVETTTNDVSTEATRRVLDVMVKDSARFAATAGWGYEQFKGDTKERLVDGPRAAQCAQCHATKKDQGYIFSVFRK